MPHAVVISTVQSLSILFPAGLIAGIYYLNLGTVCLLGGAGDMSAGWHPVAVDAGIRLYNSSFYTAVIQGIYVSMK